MPGAQRLGEHERLERGAGLALALGREVERRLRVVVAADHRAHLAGLVLDRHHRRARAGLVREPVADRGRGRLLDLRVERRLDGEAAGEGAPGAELAAAELVDDLLLDPRGEVGVLRVLARRRDVRARGQALGHGLVVLRLGDEPLLEHAVEHHVAALRGPRRGARPGRSRSGEATMPASSAASWRSSWAAHGRALSSSQPVVVAAEVGRAAADSMP